MGGPDISPATSAETCTYDFAEWQRRCASSPEGMAQACEGLNDSWRDRALLRLSLAASAHHLQPGDLQNDTLTVGAYAGLSLADLLATAEATDEPAPELREAVAAGAHAFDGCVNTGLVAESETIPICGGDGTVEGPVGGACHALDGECGRGYFEASEGCCRIRPRALGVTCAAGEGRCDGNGGCIPFDSAEVPEREWPEAADPELGLPSFIDYTGVEAPAVWHGEDGRLRLSVGGTTRVELTPPQGARLAYQDIHVIGPTANGSALGVVVDRPDVRRTLHLLPPPTADARERDSGAADASVDTTHAADQLADRSWHVVAARQSAGALAAAFSTVTQPERVELDCPGETAGIRCDIVGDQIEVTGTNLAFASVRREGSVRRVPTALYGICLFPPCSPSPAQCTFGQSRICTAVCGRSGRQYCTYNKQWGTCHAYTTGPEVCNGVDDDCDGQIDENGAELCDDGLTCNVDSCQLGLCRHTLAPSCHDSHTCATALCAPSLPTGAPPGLSYGVISAANHCYELLNDTYCTNTWDACNCNGAEYCAPSSNPDPSGCIMSPGISAPCEAHDGPKPDDTSDPFNVIHHPGGACTVEACIEDSPTCNWDHIGLGDRENLRLARQGWDFAMRRKKRHHSGTPYTRPDGTTVTVQCPNTKIWGQKTYLEIDCNDDNTCTTDYCDPHLGLAGIPVCTHDSFHPGNACDPRGVHGDAAHGGGPLACGTTNMACDGAGHCTPSYVPHPFHAYATSCPAIFVAGPNGTTMVRRSELPSEGSHYKYGPSRAPIPSCHLPICLASGDCGVAVDHSQCHASASCMSDVCTTSTDIMDSNGVVGCMEVSTCPAPPACPMGYVRPTPATQCNIATDSCQVSACQWLG